MSPKTLLKMILLFDRQVSFSIPYKIIDPSLLLQVAPTHPSRGEKAGSSSKESTGDEGHHPTSLREPSKQQKTKSTASETGTFESTTSKSALTHDEPTPFEVEHSESDEAELDEDPSSVGDRESSEQENGYSSIDEADLGRAYPEGPPKVLPCKDPLVDDPGWKRCLGLDWSDEQVDEYLGGLPVLQFTKLSKEERNDINRKDYWIAESEPVAQAYRPFFAEKKLAEPRRPRRSVFYTKPGAWK